jgi:hypothetical protein
MSDVEQAITYVFAWHALSDACPKCQNLNGREWHDQDLFQGVLWDPIWGNVWNLDADHSMAHGDFQYNCRCQLEVRVNFDITQVEEYVVLMDTITLYGKPVTIYREAETGRFAGAPR